MLFKAERYAQGDYENEGEGAIKIIEQKEPTTPIEKEAFQGDIHGFDDLDGDGDPLIDDAIIEE